MPEENEATESATPGFDPSPYIARFEEHVRENRLDWDAFVSEAKLDPLSMGFEFVDWLLDEKHLTEDQLYDDESDDEDPVDKLYSAAHAWVANLQFEDD